MVEEFPLNEFHNIMPICNIPSVMERGILSHNEMVKLQIPHQSVANEEVQRRRTHVHPYANLYFDARNPMMYALKENGVKICVLAVDVKIMSREGVLLTDMNAAKSMVRYYSVYQWPMLDFDKILARYWNDDDENIKMLKKAYRCAEVLVPACIPYDYVTHAYVCNEEDKKLLLATGFDKLVKIQPDLFFS